MSTVPAPHPAPGLLATVRAVGADIKLAHSVFALPFAVLGAFLARPLESSWTRFAGQLALIVLCMVLARTWAMVVNRLADREIDARNPRTARRVFASGRLAVSRGVGVLAVCNLLFAGACSLYWFMFRNPWPLVLAEPVLAWIAFYSFTKRFTWLCHVFLGGALAASPVAAAIAINPGAIGLGASLGAPLSAHAGVPAVWWLALMVVLWVAGFDVIYALQDVDVDRREKLFSIPSRLGVGAALWISRGLHAGALAALLMAWRTEPRFGPVFAAAAGLVGALLIAEHAILARRGRAGLEMAFFTVNGVVSCVLGAAGCVDAVF